MFTVCPKCMLTLAVTANDLRMGQGYVRCGRCANVFNALLALSEEPVEDSTAAPTPADRASQSQIAAALGQDSPAKPTETRDTSAPSPPPAEAADHGAVDEAAAEGVIENESNFDDGTGTFETIVLEGEAITQTEEYVPEESVDHEIAELAQRLGLAAKPSDDDAGPAEEAAAAAEDLAIGAEEGTAEDATEVEGLEQPSAPQVMQRRWPWVTASVLLVLLLALQALHHWRNTLATSPAWHDLLTRSYAALGLQLDPHWNVAAYDVRQQGAVADPNDSQIIRVRLSLANRAPRAQPVPLLRLTLLDRYGKRIASSELTPEQYWPPALPPRAYLASDERIDSEISVRDPNAASASFELDVCLRAAAGTLRCAGDATPTTGLGLAAR